MTSPSTSISFEQRVMKTLADITADIQGLHDRIGRASLAESRSKQVRSFAGDAQSDPSGGLNRSSRLQNKWKALKANRSLVLQRTHAAAEVPTPPAKPAPVALDADDVPQLQSDDFERSVSPVVASGDAAANLCGNEDDAMQDIASQSMGEKTMSQSALIRDDGAMRRKKRVALDHDKNDAVATAAATWHHNVVTHPPHIRFFNWLTALSLDPDGYVVICFDAIFVAVTVAYILALTWMFLSPASSFLISQEPTPFFTAVFIVAQGITCCWVASRLFLRFKTGYEVIDDPGIIRDAYLKSRWFALDLFLAIPFDFIFLLYPPAFYVSLWRHPLLRAIRIIKLSESADPLLPSSRAWILLLAFFGTTMCIAHLAICLFWKFEETDSTTGRPLTYVDCMYWVIATLSSTGYGDISARTQSSRTFATFLMLAGMAIIAATTAIVTTFLATKDVLEEEHDRMRRMMGSMLRHYGIPWQLQKEVVALFPNVLASSSENQFKLMIRQLPSFMEQRVESYLRAKLLRQVPLFAPLAERDEVEILLLLAQKMEPVVVQASEYIINAGEIGDEMFVLVHGSVDVLIPTGSKSLVNIIQEDGSAATIEEPDEVRVATLRSGSFFGEIALIEDTPRTASIVALQTCELLVLTRRDFDTVVKKSVVLQQALDAAAKQRREAIASQQKTVVTKLLERAKPNTDAHNPLGSPPNPIRSILASIRRSQQTESSSSSNDHPLPPSSSTAERKRSSSDTSDPDPARIFLADVEP